VTSNEQPRFVVVGAFVADCLVRTDRLPEWDEAVRADSIRMSPGGKALNQAVVLARQGAQVTALGTIGNDAIGRDLLETLRGEGVDTSAMVTRKTPTGICLVLSDSSARNAIVWRLSDELALTPDDIRAAEPAFHQADTALITFEVPLTTAAEAITTAQRHGARVVLNPAPPPQTPPTGDFPWDGVDVLIPNEAEARALLPTKHPGRTGSADELPQLLFEKLAVPTICVTLADQGSAVWHDGQALPLRTDPVTATDPTGAGDTFAAVFAYLRSAGTPTDHSIRRAMAAAAATVGRPGSFYALPAGSRLRPNT
jgi:ribokinase